MPANKYEGLYLFIDKANAYMGLAGLRLAGNSCQYVNLIKHSISVNPSTATIYNENPSKFVISFVYAYGNTTVDVYKIN